MMGSRRRRQQQDQTMRRLIRNPHEPKTARPRKKRTRKTRSQSRKRKTAVAISAARRHHQRARADRKMRDARLPPSECEDGCARHTQRSTASRCAVFCHNFRGYGTREVCAGTVSAEEGQTRSRGMRLVRSFARSRSPQAARPWPSTSSMHRAVLVPYRPPPPARASSSTIPNTPATSSRPPRSPCRAPHAPPYTQAVADTSVGALVVRARHNERCGLEISRDGGEAAERVLVFVVMLRVVHTLATKLVA
ncbi:hypothetical protein C8R44DRAFT_168941 [Mycena epipterygia]|nr:hypothetical protein C8R44DRAFT_168941 [Mycena epipterygia]